MTPTYHIKQTSTSIEELNLAQSLTVSSSSGRAFFSSDQDVGGPCHQELQSPELRSEDDKLVEHQGLPDQLLLPNNYERPEDQEDHDDRSSPKWLPSKVRIIRKMRSPNQVDGNCVTTNSAQKSQDQKQFASPSIDSDSSSRGTSYRNTDNTVRVCSDCNTTKTPLWRSGPRGPKSLCNACGIRQRKARRALAAASGTIIPPATSSFKIKVKRTAKRSKSDGNDDPQFQRGCKNKLPPNPSPRKKNNLCYEDFTLRILGKHYSAHQRVFPQDEREAAILLMALSYGLVRG